MGDETSSDELSDHLGEIGGDGLHSVLEVLGESFTVGGEIDDLLGEGLDVGLVLVVDLSSHGDFGGLLDLLLEFFGEDAREVSCGGVVSHSDGADGLGVDEVVGDDLGDFWEVPSVPFSESHHVVVEFLIEVIEEGDGLDDHGIDFFDGELEFVPRESVGETESHFFHVVLAESLDEGVELGLQSTVEVDVSGLDLDSEGFLDLFTEFFVGDFEGFLDFSLDNIFFEELAEGFWDFTGDQLGG